MTPIEIYIDVKDDEIDRKRHIIQHDTSNWTTLFVEMDDKDGGKFRGSYIINNN